MAAFTELAHETVREHLRTGDVVIDATVGNGHDTAFLARLVGPTGRVFGFDVQAEAIRRVGAVSRVNVTLIQGDHARMTELLPREVIGGVAAVMFNLGYLPGGDKVVTTTTASTLAALDAAWSALRNGGVLTVVAYRGHPGGLAEADAVRDHLRRHGVAETPASSSPVSPVLFVARKATS
jgi:predicted methyltransferase